jgi:hypothetical protein
MINSTYTLDNKYAEGDHLITTITIQYTGDINENVTTNVYHFRPQTIDEVEQNIQNRIIFEKDRIIARNNIERLISEL